MKNSIILFLFGALSFVSCTKEPGFGGKASIKGKITVISQSELGIINATYPAMDQNTFIVYGDQDNIVDDENITSHDGTFEFKHLYPGKYQVFTYSDHPGEIDFPRDSVVSFEVEISEKNQVVDLGEIFIVKIQ